MGSICYLRHLKYSSQKMKRIYEDWIYSTDFFCRFFLLFFFYKGANFCVSEMFKDHTILNMYIYRPVARVVNPRETKF